MKQTDIKYIALHCSATKPDQDIGVSEINQMHLDRGWSGIGYHFVIRLNGALEIGRPLTNAGAHVYGFNRISWGVCLIGGLDENGDPSATYNTKQLRTLRQLITTMLSMQPLADIRGHRDFSPDVNGDGMISRKEFIKDCPCFDAAHWWAFDEVIE